MTASESAGARDNAAAPGVALRAARTAQNLSVGEVARQLRLSVAQIEALETSAFERLPGQVFVRGFIRNYARLLKLDPDPLLRDLAPAAEPEPELRVANVSRSEPLARGRAARWPWYLLAVVMVLAALGAYEFLNEGPSRPAGDDARGREPVAVPPALPITGAAPPADSAPARSGGEAPETAAAPESAAPAQVATAPAAPGSTEPAPQSAPREGEIRMSFEHDSWVEIRDGGGHAIFSQLNRGGSEQRVAGRPPFIVIVGNARGVRLTYNDRVIDLAPHMKYDVARLTLE